MSKMIIIEGNSNDKDNTRNFMVKGEKGETGFSPTIETEKEGHTATVIITDVNGTHTVELNDGDTYEVPTNSVICFDGDTIPEGYIEVENPYATKEMLSAVASPLVASSISEMTDTTKIYVNTTDGKWYYYDGASWNAGGIYQASEDSENVLLNTENISIIANKINAYFANLWKSEFETTTNHGITYTINADKSISLSGTSDYLSYIHQTLTLPAGDYILNGCTGGSSSTYHILYVINGTTNYQTISNAQFSLSEETTIDLYIRVMNGVTVDTTIYPMIMKKENYTTEYVPYGILYIKYNLNKLIEDITGYSQINLLSNEQTSGTYNGVNVTVNDDKSVTFNGTALSTFIWGVNNNCVLPAGKYIASGISNGGENTYRMRIIIGSTFYNSFDKPIEFTLEETSTVRYVFSINGGFTFANDTVYPMIRKADIYNDKYVPYREYQIYKPIQKLINYTKFNWSGKKMNVIGDSIVQGSYGNFINVIGGILNLSEVRNYGIGGSLLASSSADSQYSPACTRYTNMSDDADIIIVHAGTNDYSAQISLGADNSTDITTFNGALNVLMEGLRNKYPDKLIIFDSILHRYNDSSLPIKASQYRECIENRCLANHIVFYDCYKYSGFDFVKGYYDHILTVDGLHPNQKGADILGRKLAGFINWQ